MQDLEFTIENGNLWMLQTRNGKRTAKAALKIALDMINEKGYDNEIIYEVGLNTETVKKIILLGAVSHKLLNTIISSYNNESVSIF
jgi:phosphoenolpyruvate synthase/pyruvate phosphate dikinase